MNKKFLELKFEKLFDYYYTFAIVISINKDCEIENIYIRNHFSRSHFNYSGKKECKSQILKYLNLLLQDMGIPISKFDINFELDFFSISTHANLPRSKIKSFLVEKRMPINTHCEDYTNKIFNISSLKQSSIIDKTSVLDYQTIGGVNISSKSVSRIFKERKSIAKTCIENNFFYDNDFLVIRMVGSELFLGIYTWELQM